MESAMRKFMLGMALASIAGAAMAQGTPSGDAKAGLASFNKYGCYTCHGIVGQGTLRDGPRLNPPMPLPAMVAQLRTPRYEMPAYTEIQMPEKDIADIYAYLVSLPKNPDPKAIRELQ
jgi:ubiquinol-cytochrome c reductase cytochrome c subunit